MRKCIYTPTQQKIDVFHITLQDENRAEIKHNTFNLIKENSIEMCLYAFWIALFLNTIFVIHSNDHKCNIHKLSEGTKSLLFTMKMFR